MSAAVSIAALALAPSAGLAQQKTLYVAGYGGSFEKTIRDEVIPAFEKANGVKVEYVAGNSTDTLAKLQAQKGNQQIDVAIVDDGPMYQAIQLGFCGKIEGLPADLYEAARFKDDRAVGIGLVAHRPDVQHQGLRGEGLGAADLLERSQGSEVPEAAGHPADQQHLRPAHAADARQDERRRRDQCRRRLQDHQGPDVNPNVLAYEPSPGKMTELFQSGQAVLAVWGTGRVQSFANTGFPVDFVYPKEGAATLLTTACPIAKPNASPLASSFVKTLLEPKIQLVLLKDYGYGPVTEDRSWSRRSSARWRRSASAPPSSINARLGRHQRQARGVDQALESRGRALSQELSHSSAPADTISAMVRRDAAGPSSRFATAAPGSIHVLS